MSSEADVIVIGAGLAGLGAAHELRRHGVRAVVLEASDHIGGRAVTDYPAALGGVWFDRGAVWFHDAENNPLTAIARAKGDRLLQSDQMRVERTYVGGRLATPAELADYDAAWPRFTAAADRLIAARGDVPLSAVTASLPDDPWAPTIEAWEGPVICVADGHRFSALDWRRNALGGSNLVPEGGIGAFVQRHLGEGLDIRLNTPVQRIRWNGPGGRIEADGLTARACIVTVSTGVLASGALRFEPDLPAATQEAIAALPMGLAIKVALRANRANRLGLASHTSVDRQVGPGEQLVPFQCWPHGRDYIQGWIGGGIAWDLARQGEEAVVDYALGHLRALFGGQVDALFGRGQHHVTAWHADPWVRGGYSYVPPGKADARRHLAEPVGGGHLLFAGEACHDGYAGTVAGAWLSGQEAARAVVI